ncbi:hypothetical protein LBMAG48_04910 [Phycisphaerae bacterium]|nr:hypothetical protein LBMAG48_04910 [Phycisphaerae bacterium]
MLSILSAVAISGVLVAAEPQPVTLIPSHRVGDVIRCAMLTTMSMDLPEYDEPFLKNFMQDSLIVNAQDVTWTISRVEPDFSVIQQKGSANKSAAAQPQTTMTRIMLMAYDSFSEGLDFRVSRDGQIEDVLNAGEVTERFQKVANAMKKEMAPQLEKMDALSKQIDGEASSAVALDIAFNSPQMREMAINRYIGIDLFPGAWVWGKTFTPGEPLTENAPASSMVGMSSFVSSVGNRTATLYVVNEYEVRVTWTTTMTVKAKETKLPEVDLSALPQKARDEHNASMDKIKQMQEPQSFEEIGDMRLDRRTGFPIAGTVTTRGGNSSTRLTTSVVYSAAATTK